jgi:hypothetical protein
MAASKIVTAVRRSKSTVRQLMRQMSLPLDPDD